MNQVQLEAFFDELEEIEKCARWGIMERLGKGTKKVVEEKVVPAFQRFGRGVKQEWKRDLGEMREGARGLKRAVSGPPRVAHTPPTISELARRASTPPRAAPLR